MSRQLTWKHLSVEQVEEYLSLVDAPSRLAFLRAVSDLPDDAELAAITLDLYQYAMQFAQRRGFTADKVSALYSLAKETHESSMNNFWPARRSFEHFKELLLMHSVQRPPYSVGLYTLSDARAITDFFSAGYFRHYMLYKYAFTKKTEMRFATYYTRTVAVPEPFMLPMGEAEEEEKFLARQEQEKLDQLGTGNVMVSAEELEKTGVPEEMREQLLAAVNEKLAAAQAAMEAKFAAEHNSLANRVAGLSLHNLAPPKDQTQAA